MAKGSFLLVNLREDKAKKLAQVIANESCRKILDYLTEKSATESQLASRLDIPLSTVHYNMQALVNAGLVQAEEFHYSPKGREVLHYQLANKYIIIAPKSTYGIKEKLKSILPITVFIGALAFIVQFFSQSRIMATSTQLARDTAQVVQEKVIVDELTSAGAPAVKVAAEEGVKSVGVSAAQIAADVTTTTTTTTLPPPEVIIQAVTPSLALWFFLGVVTAFVLYLLIDYLFYKKK